MSALIHLRVRGVNSNGEPLFTQGAYRVDQIQGVEDTTGFGDAGTGITFTNGRGLFVGEDYTDVLDKIKAALDQQRYLDKGVST